MCESRQKCIRVWREIDSCSIGFEVQDRADEGRILMRESIMFLPSPSTGLDIVDAADVFPPRDFLGHFVEFAVLSHHRMHDSEKALVSWEDACATSQSVALKEACFALSSLSLRLDSAGRQGTNLDKCAQKGSQ